jgi:hypothetical protein
VGYSFLKLFSRFGYCVGVAMPTGLTRIYGRGHLHNPGHHSSGGTFASLALEQAQAQAGRCGLKITGLKTRRYRDALKRAATGKTR